MKKLTGLELNNNNDVAFELETMGYSKFNDDENYIVFEDGGVQNEQGHEVCEPGFLTEEAYKEL